MSATMNECQVGIHDLWQVGMHDLWQVYVHKTVRNWNVLYMTCSRYGWINTGSLVAFWPIACSKHNIPCSKSVWLWSINYPAPDWGTCWSWCWKRLPGNDYLPTTISAVSFSCSNSPPNHYSLCCNNPTTTLTTNASQTMQCIKSCFLGEHPSISL